MGSKTTTTGASKPDEEGFDESHTIKFGRTYAQKPEIIVSISEFERQQKAPSGDGDRYVKDLGWGVRAKVQSKSTTGFELKMVGWHTQVPKLSVSWIACGEMIH